MPSDFDITSKQYDNVFTFSNIGKAQRNRVFKYLGATFLTEKKLSILELNCGTGEDAIAFSKLQHDVIATDISEEMIKVAKTKAYPHNLKFKVQDINTLTEKTFDKKFDLIFSNFGGFNCLSKMELQAFLKTSVKLLNPNGKLILVIMPKHCLWERIYFLSKGHFKKVKRRSTNKILLANVNGVAVSTWYHNPKEIVNLTKLMYKTEMIKPVGISIPPSYLESSVLAKKPILNLLIGIEKLLGYSFLAKYADHFFIQLKKKEEHC